MHTPFFNLFRESFAHHCACTCTTHSCSNQIAWQLLRTATHLIYHTPWLQYSHVPVKSLQICKLCWHFLHFAVVNCCPGLNLSWTMQGFVREVLRWWKVIVQSTVCSRLGNKMLCIAVIYCLCWFIQDNWIHVNWKIPISNLFPGISLSTGILTLFQISCTCKHYGSSFISKPSKMAASVLSCIVWFLFFLKASLLK